MGEMYPPSDDGDGGCACAPTRRRGGIQRRLVTPKVKSSQEGEVRDTPALQRLEGHTKGEVVEIARL